MRKLNLLILVLTIILSTRLIAQNEVILTFTGKGIGNIYQKLDSVKIMNLTQGWTEVITGDDTTLILNSALDITENCSHT